MVWTRDPPNIPGWYWFNGIAGAEAVTIEIVELDYGEQGILNTVSSGSCGEELQWPDIAKFQGDWMGPIEGADS